MMSPNESQIINLTCVNNGSDTMSKLLNIIARIGITGIKGVLNGLGISGLFQRSIITANATIINAAKEPILAS